ncbi:velvet factor-domain-containing protein [Pseudomassariella vexata]|uniref:Velvet factor-domain-containing protein n=1 Tax=Pseudomassariella vexata TaxID=1141098 RepID=A0A1Y2E373_9PEZI|nr:velvet factor-domain-containing protein [Pseudomassariella vexata]ORY65814.1 velvet factor-domain-containing protein [Pseudomassariella vexata]
MASSQNPLPPIGTLRTDIPPENGVTTPSASSLPPSGKEIKDITELPPHDPPKEVTGSDGNRVYKLEVTQQPVRARMCGFGDKDRRPITPPPCVRLAVVDKETGNEIDFNSVDHQLYVLTVDLWSYDGTKEVNLVKHSSNSPSISASQHQSFRELEQAPYNPQSQMGRAPPPGTPYQQQMPGYSHDFHGQSKSRSHVVAEDPLPNPTHSLDGYNGSYHSMGSYQPAYQPMGQSMGQFGGRYPQEVGPSRLGNLQAQQANGMYTRNLIGNLATSASRLTDDNEKIGIWFILQDLSVRTEGFFRLRFSYTALGIPGTSTNGQTSDNLKMNKTKAKILAQCFSDVFQVYSAKKFPGVCESTALSKTFANQGIKIPIRKEGDPARGRRGQDDDDGEDEEE